jgi:hemerythrin
LVNCAREFADRFESGQNATTLEYLVFLADWVKEHTTTTDRELGQYQLMHPID